MIEKTSSECKAEAILAGGAIPRTCPTCGVYGACAKGYEIRVEDGRYAVSSAEEPTKEASTQRVTIVLPDRPYKLQRVGDIVVIESVEGAD